LSGECLSFVKPPIGVILGSKMAAAREQDMMDIHYIVQNSRTTKKVLRIGWVFSQKSIKKRLMFLDVYAGLRFDQKSKNTLKKK